MRMRTWTGLGTPTWNRINRIEGKTGGKDKLHKTQGESRILKKMRSLKTDNTKTDQLNITFRAWHIGRKQWKKRKEMKTDSWGEGNVLIFFSRMRLLLAPIHLFDQMGMLRFSRRYSIFHIYQCSAGALREWVCASTSWLWSIFTSRMSNGFRSLPQKWIFFPGIFVFL